MTLQKNIIIQSDGFLTKRPNKLFSSYVLLRPRKALRLYYKEVPRTVRDWVMYAVFFAVHHTQCLQPASF